MNRNNPYAPPKAAVEDAPEPAIPRPRVVEIALWLLWSELAITTLRGVYDALNPEEGSSLSFELTATMLVVAISVWLNYKIWDGRNWARIATLVLTLLAVISVVPSAATFFEGEPIEAMAMFVSLALDLAAMYLVFVPGRGYFRRGACPG